MIMLSVAALIVFGLYIMKYHKDSQPKTTAEKKPKGFPSMGDYFTSRAGINYDPNQNLFDDQGEWDFGDPRFGPV